MSPRLIPASALAIAAGVLALPATAAAVGGGAGPGTPLPGATPTVSAVACARACPAVMRVAPGTSVVAVVGTHLDGALQVRFLGGKSADDNTVGTAVVRSAGKLEAQVPPHTHSGPIQVVSTGRVSKITDATVAVGSRPADFDAAVDRTQLTDGQKITVRYVAQTEAAVKLELLRQPAGTVAASWSLDGGQPGTVRTLSWNGRIAGRAAAAGHYAFRLRAAAKLQSTGGSGLSPAFDIVREVFPILGPHTFSMTAGRFGAGRSGHTHQGQDTFASCGTTLVAARSGTVYARTFQSLAGNYLVIDVAGGQSDMYAHLRAPALVRPGQKVSAGQKIGYVGDTGDAEGCHLHFEMWTKPGWYRGGEPYDPLPSLKRWDKQSRR